MSSRVAKLKRFLRAVLYRTGLIAVHFRVLEHKLVRGREAPPPADEGGIPIPPLALMVRTVGHADWRAFLRTGKATAEALDGHAKAAGLGFAQARRILDLGCGCGRVIRHLPAMTQAELYGADYNKSLLSWCAENLPGRYLRNGLNPPLKVSDDQFDIVYLLSVFTHLRIPTQRIWLQEFARIIRPGGLALITFHEETHMGFPDTPEARAAIAAKGFYYNNNMVEGSNLISTFQTKALAEEIFSAYFEIVRIAPSEEAGVGQSLAVLRARAVPEK